MRIPSAHGWACRGIWGLEIRVVILDFWGMPPTIPGRDLGPFRFFVLKRCRADRGAADLGDWLGLSRHVASPLQGALHPPPPDPPVRLGAPAPSAAPPPHPPSHARAPPFPAETQTLIRLNSKPYSILAYDKKARLV
jgi:hypothetical protein